MTWFSDPSYGPILTFVVISFVISLITLIVYKLTTNQHVMKQLRDDIKKYQEQMKHTKDTQKLLDIQKKAMDVNMNYMMQSMRPTLFTLLPILLVFGWVSANLSFAQIHPSDQFSVAVTLEKGQLANLTAVPSEGLEQVSNNGTSFVFKGISGMHSIVFSDGKDTVEKNILITDKWDFVKPKLSKGDGVQGFIEKTVNPTAPSIPKESSFNTILTVHKPVHPFGAFSIFGYMPGWVMTYVSFSILFNLALRKVMNLH